MKMLIPELPTSPILQLLNTASRFLLLQIELPMKVLTPELPTSPILQLLNSCNS
jgi:hypothetical protein